MIAVRAGLRKNLICREGIDQAHCRHVFRGANRKSPFSMPSFDIVSEVENQEIDNALNQARKELATRFDFKGSVAEILYEKDKITLTAEDAARLRGLREIVIGKLSKRGVDLRNVEQVEPAISPLGHARQELKIKQGLEGNKAKEIIQAIKGQNFKVQSQTPGPADSRYREKERRSASCHSVRPRQRFRRCHQLQELPRLDLGSARVSAFSATAENNRGLSKKSRFGRDANRQHARRVRYPIARRGPITASASTVQPTFS